MQIETERKFLVKNDAYKAEAVETHRIRQGYIAHDSGRSVRVRLWDERAILTVKGPFLSGASRMEWEKEITPGEAEELFFLCKPGGVDKIRYIIPAGNGRRFEVDEFFGENQGLVLAEIELGSEDEAFSRPSWLGEEVTGDPRYYNGYLARKPFTTW